MDAISVLKIHGVKPSIITASYTGTTGRFVGATSSGAPATGTFSVGDYVVDQTGAFWICTTAGSPGTWTKAGGSAGGPLKSISAQLLSSTSATTIYTYTPSLQGNFVCWLYTTVITAQTILTATITYNDAGGAQTYYIYNADSLPVGSHAAVPV